ncbi:MAG TPA: sialidase family protein [Acidimicrobiales bacterium]|nr:sialidase family protein [Acidimicrobiales bacterium]
MALVATGTAAPARAGAAAGEGMEPLGVTAPTAVTSAGPGNQYSYSSPSVVVDPDDPLRLYVAAVELRTRRCVFFRSSDGGRTWNQPAGSPSLASFPFCTHTSQFLPMTLLAMGRDKAIYYVHQGWSHQDDGEVKTTSVFLARSTDGGESWAVTAAHDARRLAVGGDEINYPIDVVVDPRAAAGDVVYVSWTATYPGSAPSRPPQPLIAVSLDAGGSFSKPKNVTGRFFDDPANISGEIPPALKLRQHLGGRDPDLALDGRGNLYVAWVRTSAVLDPVPPHPRYLSRSSDRGRTFSVSELTPPSHFPGPGPVIEWSPRGGAHGSLHLVYEDKVVPDQGDRDVLYRRSTDAGTNWSDARALNDDDPSQLFVQVLPNLSTARDGRLDVAWWDQRDANGRYAVDLYSVSSPDGGANWSRNVRLTDRSIDRRSGSWVDHHGDTRQRPATASATALLHAVWDDTRGGGTTDGEQSLWTTTVQFANLADSRPTAWSTYGVAAASGLAIGVFATAALMVRRRASSSR